MEVLTDGEYFIEDNSVRPPREWKSRNGMDNALVYVMSIEENIPKNNVLCKELWKKCVQRMEKNHLQNGLILGGSHFLDIFQGGHY